MAIKARRRSPRKKADIQTIRIELIIPPIRFEIVTPQAAAASKATENQDPIPEDIIEYIDQESEQHARDIRRRRVIGLRAELGNWEFAFKQLQLEDAGFSR